MSFTIPITYECPKWFGLRTELSARIQLKFGVIILKLIGDVIQ
jgi:hypothetical protein